MIVELLPILVSNIVVACGLAIVATVVGWSGKRAEIARWIWLTVFIKLITPPLIAVPIEFSEAWSGQLSNVSSYLSAPRVVVSRAAMPSLYFHAPAQAPTVEKSTAIASGDTTGLASSFFSVSLVDVLLAVWLLGSAWLLMRGIWRYRRMLKLLQQQSDCDHEGTQAVRELLRRNEHEFVPTVRLIRARLSPMLFGIGHGTSIVCPRELWANLDEPQRLAFLAHEAAHYVRRDHWVRWIEWMVASLYWWLPLVIWARLQLERHEEVACDQAALELLQRRTETPVRRSYAESLLSVVDFLSEADTRAPRLASRMQPTAALEERLHWIMKAPTRNTPWRASLLVGLLVGASTLLVHPTVRLWTPILAVEAVTAVSSASSQARQNAKSILGSRENELSPAIAKNVLGDKVDLPPAPRGWWNHAAEPIWADRSLGQNELHLQAKAGAIDVSRPGGVHSQFDSRDVRSLTYLPGNDRLIVGRSNGELHVWDVASARSVSLIGKHASAITSTCWSANGGLISCDRSGNVVRWDLQSGQMLASVNLDQALSTVRWSSDGLQVAVLTGSWSGGRNERRMVLLNGSSLNKLRLQRVPDETACLHHDAKFGWLAVAWSGQIYEVSSGQVICTIPKHEVSGVALCAELMPELKFVRVLDTGSQSFIGNSLRAIE